MPAISARPGDAGDGVDDAGFAQIPFAIATGDITWQELTGPDARARLIMGPQGGFHILGRLRFEGFAPDVAVRFRVTDLATGTLFNDPTDVLRRRDRQGLVRTPEGWESVSAELVIFTQIRTADQARGHRVRWDVELEEASSGRRARTSREFLVE
ncbi:MAG: hypothetical protein Q8Q09_05655 [Deltaproteobacteria bacterium]|nr:hypothetical protein [Deltaproteobacteria bacterium]